MGYQNFFATTLFTDIGAADTTITLTTAPSKTSGRLVLEARNPTQREIIRYSGVSGNQITGVLRGQGDTTAKSHTKNSLVEMNLTAQDIQDLYDAFNSFSASANDWRTIPTIPTVVSNNGQKEHLIRYSGVDLTGTIGEGYKLRIPRTGTTPTTSMSFVAASSQSASKSSPVGLNSFTDFSVEGLIYVPDFSASSVAQVIMSRLNVGSVNGGWYFNIRTDGCLQVGYASGGNLTTQGSVQSIPLGKWVHVAATVVVATKVITLYIDGVSVALQTPFSSAATGITHPALDLTIGAYSGTPANSYFNGRMANLRLWSGIRSAQQIKDNMGQEVPTSTTGLLGQWKGNGSWNDSSVNANHLTPANGAVNNFASHPYSANEYAIVTAKPVFSGGNTDVTVFTGSGFLPNEALGTTAYSTARVPFGFPAARANWELETVIWIQVNKNAVGGQILTLNGLSLSVPTGAWQIGYKGNLLVDNAGGLTGKAGLSRVINAMTELETVSATNYQSGSYTYSSNQVAGDNEVLFAAQAPLYLSAVGASGSINALYWSHATLKVPTIIYARSAYL